jgi:hypothetical protein
VTKTATTWLGCAGLLLMTLQAAAGDERFRFEVAAGWPDFDPSDHALPPTGPEIPEEVAPVDVRDPGFSLEELTFTAELGRFDAFLGWDTEPDGTTHQAYLGDVTDVEYRASAYDLGVAYPLLLGATTVLRPLAGLTNVRRQSTQHRTQAPFGELYMDDTLTVRFDGWGLLAGCEVAWEVSSRVRLAARVLQRWAAGTSVAERNGRYALVDLETHEVLGYEEREGRSSGNGSTMMFGGNAGLGVRLAGPVWAEGGWRYRDWDYGGFATWQGPYVSVAAAF